MASTHVERSEALSWLRAVAAPPAEPGDDPGPRFLTIGGLILSKEEWDELDDDAVVALLETVVGLG